MLRRSYSGGFGTGGMLPPAIKGLLIANGALFLFPEIIGANAVFGLFGLTPANFWRGMLWQPVTYMFFHGGFTHLLFNMLALWMFGSALESTWGTKEFLRYYFLTGVGAALSNCILMPGAQIPIVGASGAIYGLLAAYGLLFPNSIIYISFLFPIKAKYLVLLFGLFEFISSVNAMQGMQSTVAHLVHLGGMLIGVIYLKRRDITHWGARKAKSYQRGQTFEKKKKEINYESQLRQEVDDLLDKINEVGMENLTSWERRRLRQASERLKRNEEKHN